MKEPEENEQMGTDRDPGDHKPTPSSQPRDPKMQLAKILLPDGVYKEFEVNKNSEGEILFHQLTHNLSIEEREYFSLCFYDKQEGVRHWLYNDKLISKQIKGLPWEFSLEVKFYPTTPTTIVDDHARYFVFLQLRRDLLTGRLPVANVDTHALLGSFVAQMEFGDAPAEMNEAYEKFIVDSKLVPSAQATPETFQKIAHLHREHRGRTTAEAEIMFLDHCRHLPLYGIHIFKATDKDKKAVDIGIGAAGINIYQDDKTVHSFNWQNIVKIGYKRTYFSIKLKAGTLDEKSKDEKTLYYKLPTYVAAKRTWKCAVEHHTFFRLIQPDDKPHKGFFNFGSQRFRYHGRTQFQTKIASQMFDKPSTVDRAPSAMSQPIASAEDQKLQTLNLTDSELEQRQFERYRRALTPKSYTSSRQDEDAISTATFAKYSRPSTLLVVSTSGGYNTNQQDLSYSPRGDDSSNYSSAAYYMSERSSLRTPSSAYYPPSEYTSPTSPVYFEGQHSGEYHVQMRQTVTTSSGASGSGARRNLFGRASDARSSKASRDSVRLVSFHEPVDPNEPIPNTYPVNELPQIPIERIVHVYHEGRYERLSPRRQQRPELPYGFGNYTPRNGVSHVDNLQPDGEMDQQPIRFYVDVTHSGASRRDPTKRLSHPGKEDVKEKIDPKDYEFSAASSSDPLHRTELGREVQPANIHQYTRRYHPGDYSQLSEAPKYKLITHVHPLVVSNREESRKGQSSSNVTATISQREQVVSTKVRRESPDADRRVRLSASVDRSGNLTDTTEDLTRSATTTTEMTTTTTVITTSETADKKKKKQKKPKIPPSSKVTEPSDPESRSRFGGFFTKKTTQKTTGYPESTSEFSGQLDTTNRTHELESSAFEHQETPVYSPKKTTTTIVTSSSSTEHYAGEKVKKEKRSLVAVETPEVPKKYRLIARTRHEGEEDTVDTPGVYAFSTDVHEGPVEDFHRQSELHHVPLRAYSDVKYDVESFGKEPAKSVETKQKKVKATKKINVPVVPDEQETREVRLIARVKTEPEEEQVAVPVVKEQKPKKEKFGFFSRTTKTTKTTGYPETSDAFTGELDTTDREHDLEASPFEHTQTPTTSPQRSTKKIILFGRIRHDGDEEVVEKPDPYALDSTAYEGPLEETSLQSEIDQLPISDFTDVQYSGESWNYKKPVTTPEKKQKKVKSPKKVTAPVEEPEPEHKEVRLIARVRSEPEEVAETIAKEKKQKKESSSKFGFFSKTSKTTKATGYPESSDAFTGELDTTARSDDLESSAFKHPDYPAYVPKNTEAYQPSEHSSRHEEDVVEAPAAYGFPSTSYDGPLETTVLERDLEHSAPLYPTAVPLKKSKKTKKVVTNVEKEEPETAEVRLVARVLPNEPVVSQEKSSKSKFGFFSKKGTKAPTYPEKTEGYTGPTETTSRTDDLENAPFEHAESTRIISETDPVVTHEKKRYRLLARIRHDGEEDIVEKPEAYGFAADVYDGPLDEIAPQSQLDHAAIRDYSDVRYDVETFDVTKNRTSAPPVGKKQKKQKKFAKVPDPVEPETREVRLIARVLRDDEPEADLKKSVEEKSKSKSKLSTTGFFSKNAKFTRYPETSEVFTGELETTDRTHDLERISFEHGEILSYSPEMTVTENQELPVEPEKKRYRLIARLKHEGEEDVVEKPDKYGFSTDVHEGPLEETTRDSELDHAPIGDYSDVKHSGESWNYGKPSSPVATLEKKQKKAKSPKKEKIAEPEEPETREVRIIARVKSETEEELTADPVKEKKPKKESSSKFGFFSKTTKATEYPENYEAYVGDLDSTDRANEFEGTSFEHREYPDYLPKDVIVEAVEVPKHSDKKRYRLIMRLRHEGEEDVVEKPEAYKLVTDVYDGPLDVTAHDSELDQLPIQDYADVKYTGESWNYVKPTTPVPTLEKKEKKIKTPKKKEEPLEPERRDVRLIAYVKSETDEDLNAEPVVKEKKPKKENSSKFGFFSRTSKTTKTTGYPETSDAFTGEVDTTNRIHDLEGTSFEHGEIPAYAPKTVVAETPEVPSEPEKKRYRLVARLRHDGEEDIVEKPDNYGFSTDVHEGPLDETTRESELDHAPIKDFSDVKHTGESWKSSSPVAEKKTKKVKLVKKEEIVEPVEPEGKEIRLIAYVKKFEPEEDLPVVKEKKKKDVSKSKLPSFGFFSRSTKTTKTSGYPETSEAFTGELDTTNRTHEFEGTSFEHGEIPAYSPKKTATAAEVPEVPAESENKLYRLIARWRHEGEEDVVEKPDPYAFNVDVYEGDLDETARASELEHAPLRAYSDFTHSGESWNYVKPKTPVLEKKQKKEKSPKKEKIAEPEKPETREVRLIARIKSETEEELTAEPVIEEKKPKKRDSKSKVPSFGFFHRTQEPSTSHFPTSEPFTGELETTDLKQDIESTPLEHREIPAYSPKKEVSEPVTAHHEPENRLYRLIARWRHEGEEDVVEKPDPYAFNADVYEGPLDEMARASELEQAAIGDYSDVKYFGEPWNYVKPVTPVPTLEKKKKKAKSPKKEKIAEPEEPETKEVRLIARVKSETEEDLIREQVDVEKSPQKEESMFGFFSRTTKTTEYPESSEHFSGELESTSPTKELESTSFEHHEIPPYSPSKTSSPPTLEKKEKKIKSPKKEKIEEPEEPETKEVRLIARVKSDPEEEPVIKEKKPKKESSSKFGFFSRTTKSTKATGYPLTSEAYTGELDITDRIHDLEGTSFEHGEIPSYSPKKRSETPEDRKIHVEKKMYRLIARQRHDGEEDVVEKPEFYGFSSEMYAGPLEETLLQSELEQQPLQDHCEVKVLSEVVPIKELKKSKTKTVEPVEPESREVRLIARVRTEPDDETVVEPSVKERKQKKGSSSKFGFFSKTTKTTKTTGYPETSDAFTGEIDTTNRIHDLEGTSFEHGEIPAYAPKTVVAETPEVPSEPENKRYRLVARLRHEGEEDVVEKPDKYGFSTDVHEGELEETARVSELEHAPIEDYSDVKPFSPVSTLEKKQKIKSPKKEKVDTPEEPEKKEIRLIAYVKSQPEEDVPEPVIKEKKPKKEGSSKFGFFSRTTKTTTKTAGYPETSEAYSGDLDTTVRSQEFEGTTFEHPEAPAYSPKKIEEETSEVPVEHENKLYRLIARWRHEGEEDVVEKPDPYAFNADVYEGVLDEMARASELEQAPIKNYSDVKYPGESWNYVKPKTPVLEKKQKKEKSPKKEKVVEPEEPETREVRLIARIRTETEEELMQEAPKEKNLKKGDSKSKIPGFGFFHRTSSTSHPETSEQYTGQLETTDRALDLETTPFEHAEIPAYSPKQLETTEAPIEHENKLYRLIARWRHEGEEDVVEKPDPYAFNVDVYEGDLDETARASELEHAPLRNYSDFKHTGESWNYVKPKTPVPTPEKKKKEKNIKSPKKETVIEPEKPEVKEVRLIARVKTEPEEAPVAEAEKKPKKEKSSKFGFFSKTSKTTKATGYPETSDAFTGELDTTDRSPDLEASPFEHGEIPAYSPKLPEAADTPGLPEILTENKQYRLIARIRHEGEEDVVERPSPYGFSSDVHVGPIDDIHRVVDLDHVPIRDYSDVKHSGESWTVEELTTPVATMEKKQKKVKSPKREKIAEPEEPETKEVRLIARVKSEPEEESVKEEKPKKDVSKSKLPTFGFFSRTTKSSGYPESSEAFVGELDTTDRTHDLEGTSFEHGEIPAYGPKKIVEETPEIPAETEVKRYRLIARIKHEGEEETVEKPEPYAFNADVYGGDLEEMTRDSELDHAPIGDYSDVKYFGDPWNYVKSSTPVPTPEKKQKKSKIPKKEKIVEPEEPETKEVRLIARIKTEPEDVSEPVVKEKKPKKESSSKFGFFSKTTKTTKATGYPSTSEAYSGDLDTTARSQEFEGTPFEHPEVPSYSPKKIEEETPEAPVEHENKLYRLIARWRHEGEEDVVEKPDPYAFNADVYEGGLEDMARACELEHAPLQDYSDFTHSGESWNYVKPKTPVPEKKQKKEKSPKKEKVVEPEEPETREVRLIARIRTETEEDLEPESPPKEKNLKKGDSKSKIPGFGFFHRTSSTSHPETSEQYTGQLETTDRALDLETTPFEHAEIPAYSPKQLETTETPIEHENKLYRLIARWRHEGEEDVVEKPDPYAFNADVYEGGLEDMTRASELEHAPLRAYSDFKHSGESWNYVKPKTPVLEKKQQKEKSPKKEKVVEPKEPETREVRLIARIKSEPEDEPEPVVKEEKKKQKGNFKFGFLSKSTKNSNTSGYPETSEAFTGELDTTDRTPDMENITFESKEHPAYVAMKVSVSAPEIPSEPEKKRYRLIARTRHEGEEDIVEKPDKYGFSTDVHEGPLDETTRVSELDHAPIKDFSDVKYFGEPWNYVKSTTPAPIPEKKQKRIRSVTVDIPEEPEKKEIRLIAYVKPQPEEESIPESVAAGKKSKKTRFGFFSKTTKTTGYPEASDAYTGELATTDRTQDLEGTSFEHGEIPAYAPKEADTVIPEASSSEPEKKTYRLIARLRHEGNEDVVHKPEPYTFDSTLYAGPLEEISRENELDQTPIEDHSNVQRHEELVKKEPTVVTLTKKTKKIKKEKVDVTEEPETKEVRLIARIKTEPEDVPEPVVQEKKPKKERSSKFGFFSRTTKTTTKTTDYPETSEAYSGDLETTVRSQEFEGTPFEHPEVPSYSPKKIEGETPEAPVEHENKLYRLIARWRHEGEEDVVEKPDPYAFNADVYEGTLDETARAYELEHAPLQDYSDFKHSGESWNYVKPKTPVPEKKQKKEKSPKKEKAVEPEEPETREVRLIARIKTETEEDIEPESSPKEKHLKKGGSKSKIPGFGFFQRTSSTSHPETSEQYTGQLETTDRALDLETTPFEHAEIPEYSPKKIEEETPEAPVEHENKLYRLIARWRHEGEEDVVEKPDSYALSPEVYEGVLEEMARESELEKTPIRDCVKPVTPVPTPEKKQKIKSLKKEKVAAPEEPETKEIRLIARIKTEPEEDLIAEPVVKEKKPKKEKSSNFGFFSKTTKTTAKTTEYPETSEAYIRDLDTTERIHDLESTSFEHGEIPAYAHQTVVAETQEVPAEPEKKRYRLVARLRHDGEEDVVEKPVKYGFSNDVHEGPLEETARETELDHAPIENYSDVKPLPVVTLEKKIKSPKKEKVDIPEEPEKKEIRLIAYVKSQPEKDVPEPVIKEKKPKKEGSSKFGFFSRTIKTTTKTAGYPETSEAYSGDLGTTARSQEFEGTPFEHPEAPAYSPKKIEEETSEVPVEHENKLYRLIARWRHEGEEDVVEKPDPYSFNADVYGGPLEKMTCDSEIDHAPIGDYSDVKYFGDPWNYVKSATPVPTSEKKQKKSKIPKKEKIADREEPETKEVRLIARVKSEPEEEPVSETVQKEEKPKKGSKFGFFTRTPKSKSPSETPAEPAYEGPLDTTIRSDEFETIPFDHSELIASTPIRQEEVIAVPEEKRTSRFSWFARWRHEGEEDVVEKPNPYAFDSNVYEGPLSDLHHQADVDHNLLTDYSDVYQYKEYDVKKQRKEKVKTPEPTPEPVEVKLVARIQPLEHEESPEVEPAEKASPVKERPRTSSFNIFHRQSKHHGYPEPTPLYEGHLDVTGRSQDVEKSPFEMRSDYPEYSPRKEPELTPEPPQQSRLHRLIARWRHEGEEEVVEKPDNYNFSDKVYEGPLDDLHPRGEIEQAPLTDHSEVYDYVTYRDGSKKPKSPKASKKIESEKTPEPSEPEVHQVRLLTRVKSEEPEEEVKEETTPSKPFRLRFLSLAKKEPISPSAEYPEVSPVYEGPLDLTSRSDEMEPMPYLHGATPRYSPKFTPVRTVEKVEKVEKTVKKTPESKADKKKPRLFARFRHEGAEDVVEKPEAYAHSTEVYNGPLQDTHKKEEIMHVPIEQSVDRIGEPVPPVKKIARVPPRQDKTSKFRLFSLPRGSTSARSEGYPQKTEVYEGELDVTPRAEPIEHVPLETKEFPAYSPRKSEVKSVEKASEEPAEEPKRYRLIARIKHEGDEDVVEKPDAYGFISEEYKGELHETSRVSELHQVPIRDFSDVKYNVEAFKIEKRQKKKKSVEVSESEQDDEQENVPPKSRFSFLRGQQKRVTSYPSTSYSGPLETTDLNLDLESIPLELEQPLRKYRLIARKRHDGEETEVAAKDLLPIFYSFPIARYSGPLEMTSLEDEIPAVPLKRFTRVYHSGSSSTALWNLLNARNSRASRDMDVLRAKSQGEPKKEVKLIARVLPMKKSPEKEGTPEKLTKEEQELHDALAKSAELMDTSRTLTNNLNAINYIPSSLTYHAPRPARIEGLTEEGDCYVEVRHERRAEVQLEPAYVLREVSSSQRSHAYLSTATAYFSGASASSSSAAPQGASSSSSTGGGVGGTSHSLVLPSFVGSVSEDETGLHNFSWTPLRMSPQPERMSFLARLGFKRDKSKKKDKKNKSNNKKGENETSGETSDSEHDEKREFAVVEYEPSLMATIQRAERLNASSPRLEHAERTFTVRANAPLPVSFEESGQPYTTVSTWQETSDLPEQVEVYTDENGRQITRTVKSSQVKHTVQTQSFQNYIVDGDQVPVGVVDVERSREQLTPLGQKASSSGALEAQNGVGGDSGIVETQTRTMTYEAQGGEHSTAGPPAWAEGRGEYVSSKSVTQGNRTIETITYKTEKDGIIETHCEHRVTIHSDADIDHDAELSQAILEATQMNPDMTVEKIEVRQETTQ